MPHNHDEDPRDILGDPLWDALGTLEDPPVPADFDAGFRARLHGSPARRSPEGDPHVMTGRPVMSWRPVVAGLLTAAATVALVLRPLPPPQDELALVADLEIIENLDILMDLDLLMDIDVLMAWDGAVPR